MLLDWDIRHTQKGGEQRIGCQRFAANTQTRSADMHISAVPNPKDMLRSLQNLSNGTYHQASTISHNRRLEKRALLKLGQEANSPHFNHFHRDTLKDHFELQTFQDERLQQLGKSPIIGWHSVQYSKPTVGQIQRQWLIQTCFFNC